MGYLPETIAAANFPPQLEHLSASSIKMFMRCPEQWRRRYMLGHIAPPSGVLIAGNADHAAVAASLTEKKETGELLDQTDFEQVVLETFDRKVEDAGGNDEVDWQGEKPGFVKDRTVKLASRYHAVVAPKLTPVVIEEPFELDVPGLPVKLIGYTDLLATSSDPGARLQIGHDQFLVERKTTNASKVNGEWELQANIYQMVYQEPVSFHLSQRRKEEILIAPTIPFTQTRHDITTKLITRVATQIGHLYQQFGPDEEWPGMVTHPWACGYCGYAPTCEWRK